MESIETTWYYLNEKRETSGPFYEWELVDQISRGHFGPEIYVWNENMPDWLKIKNSPLAHHLPEQPKPKPAPPPVPETTANKAVNVALNAQGMSNPYATVHNQAPQSGDDAFSPTPEYTFKQIVLWSGYGVLGVFGLIFIVATIQQGFKSAGAIVILGGAVIAGWNKLVDVIFEQKNG